MENRSSIIENATITGSQNRSSFDFPAYLTTGQQANMTMRMVVIQQGSTLKLSAIAS